MYRIIKIFWLGETVYPRTISPEPEKNPEQKLAKLSVSFFLKAKQIQFVRVKK